LKAGLGAASYKGFNIARLSEIRSPATLKSDPPLVPLPGIGSATVTILLVVGEDGTVKHCEALQSEGADLGAQVCSAFRQSTWVPAETADGPVASLIRHKVRFVGPEKPTGSDSTVP
jgi:hypothetical protein